MTSNHLSYPSDPSEKFKSSIQQLEHLPIKTFIHEFRNLPNKIIEEYGIIMSFDLENEIDVLFAAIRSQYRAKADWLEYYEADGNHLIDELRLTYKANFKSDAKRDRAYLLLAKECFLFSDYLRNYYGNNPGFLWYLIMSEMCEEDLKNSGLTGEPLLIGKKEQYERMRHAMDIMTDPKKLEPQKNEVLRSPRRILSHIPHPKFHR